jgi:hypothetical protein
MFTGMAATFFWNCSFSENIPPVQEQPISEPGSSVLPTSTEDSFFTGRSAIVAEIAIYLLSLFLVHEYLENILAMLGLFGGIPIFRGSALQAKALSQIISESCCLLAIRYRP